MSAIILGFLGLAIVLSGVLVGIIRQRGSDNAVWLAGGVGILTVAALGLLLVGLPTSASTAGWTWPTNPALIPGLLSSNQEVALNALVYPVAVVPVTQTATIHTLQQEATGHSKTPHRIGFLALTVAHPQSDHAAVSLATRRMHQDHVTLPWVVIIDPTATWQRPTVQVYWPHHATVDHAVGSAGLAAWKQATAPGVVTSTQVSPHSHATAKASSGKTPKHGTSTTSSHASGSKTASRTKNRRSS